MILIVGSTGFLGNAVTKKLAAGQPVTALVRDADSDKARALQAAGARLVTGDLKDRASLEKALAGVDTVICTASSTLSRREGDSLDTVDNKGVQTLIDVAERKGARRFIFVSFSRNITVDAPLARFKRAAEKRLESSKLDYTILLPTYLADVWLTPAVGFDVAGGKVRVYGDGRARSATWVSRTWRKRSWPASTTPRRAARPSRSADRRPIPSSRRWSWWSGRRARGSSANT